MDYERYYHHIAIRERLPDLTGSLEEDKVFIRLKFNEIGRWQRVSGDPIRHDYINNIAERDFQVRFSYIKQRFWEYEAFISEQLTRMGVPEYEHRNFIDKLFEIVQAAKSPVEAIVVGVWDVTDRVGDESSYRPNLRPASTSSIEGLEQVTLVTGIITRTPSCAICLEDFDEQDTITGLPCRHHFHLHCIVQCLEINHLCPLCRFAMPTQED